MTYSIEIAPSWAPVVGTSHQSNRNVIYRYRVELNAAGGIIGGEWLSNERPDFLWTQGMPLFEGEFQLLGKIYGKATDPATVSLPMPRTTPQPMPQPATPSSRT
ncbi:MAG: hypothetical protein NTZ90_17125 [Proteobacteria bacterium]|nr:hypothetical protein [Pseudomonadota bacterium]